MVCGWFVAGFVRFVGFVDVVVGVVGVGVWCGVWCSVFVLFVVCLLRVVGLWAGLWMGFCWVCLFGLFGLFGVLVCWSVTQALRTHKQSDVHFCTSSREIGSRYFDRVHNASIARRS